MITMKARMLPSGRMVFTAQGPWDSLGQLLVLPCLAITMDWKSQQPSPDQSNARAQTPQK